MHRRFCWYNEVDRNESKERAKDKAIRRVVSGAFMRMLMGGAVWLLGS